MTMSGPFLTGYTQTINDYYDREIDAINEPDRPIPSGKPQHSQPDQYQRPAMHALKSSVSLCICLSLASGPCMQGIKAQTCKQK